MKKILFTLACMLSMSISAFGLANSAVLLQHGDQVTTYLADQLQDALDAAVDGDAIFLNKGTFSGFTITKQITIRGAGAETIIDGDVNIEIPDNPTLTRTLLESLSVFNHSDSWMNGSIIIKASVDGLKLVKVSCGYLTASSSDLDNEPSIKNMILDRCLIGGWRHGGGYFDSVYGISLNEYIKSLTAINCRIWGIGSYSYDEATQLTIINSNVYHFQENIINGLVFNSIICSSHYGANIKASIFENCFICSHVPIDSSCTVENCYYDEGIYAYDHYCIFDLGTTKCIYTTEELIEKGYLGNDGTVVGIYGGTTPYVDGLTPIAPTVTESLLKVDNENRKLNVKLTVSPK